MPDLQASLASALADRYRIIGERGRGGMATVHLAEDLKHHRTVAIKVLNPELAAAIGPERFLREIQITAGLRHPHILPLYDSGQVELRSLDDQEGGASSGAVQRAQSGNRVDSISPSASRALTLLWYAMPCVEGESLRERLRRDKQIPLDEAIEIARQVADALDYAHSRGVVHRDITPDNIMLESGHAVVADFGIATAMTAADSSALTATGVTVGTPGYMSPEQFMAEPVDGRSDIYALGCVLYEMLAGEPPYTGPSAQVIITKRLSQPLPRLTTVREAVPPELESVVHRALARLPVDRFASAADFKAALRAGPGGPQWVERPSGPWRLLGLFALASAAILGAVAFVASRVALPEWVLPGAAALLLIGLPFVLGSMLVQRGTLRPSPRVARLLAWRRTLPGGAIALAAWGVAVTVWLLLGGRTPAANDAGPPTIAVLPFEVTGLDSALWSWGAATLVSTSLDGVGNLRRVDTRTLQSALRRRSAGRDGAVITSLAAARQVGARYVLAGSIVNAVSSLRISADLYDARSGSQLGQSVQVAGSTDSVPALLDRLSIEVLRRTPLVGAVANMPQTRMDRALSHSPDAVKAWLAGDELYRRSRWQGAIEQFNQAVELDSTFALAWFRLSLAHAWLGNFRERLGFARRASRFADDLPEREQLLVQGLLEFAEGKPASISVLEDYTRRYPDDVEGWSLLGAAAWELNGLLLQPLDEVRSALWHAIDLDPWFGPAYPRLLQDGFQRVDSSALRRLLPGYRNIDSKSDFCVGNLLAWGLAFGDSTERTWATGSLDTLGAGPGEPLYCTAVELLGSPDYHEPLQLVLQSMARPERPPDARDAGHFMRIGDLVNQGRIREARAILDNKLQPDQLSYPLALAGILSAVHYDEPATASRIKRILRESPYRAGPFWAGVIAVAEGLPAEVAQATRQMRDHARAIASTDELGAAGNLAAARALELYADLRRTPRDTTVREMIGLLPRLGFGADTYASRLLRYEIGRAFLSLGQPAEAQRVFETFTPDELAGEWAAPLEYYLGRTAEDLGSPDARIRYQRFLQWWQNADPELLPWREDARERLARLVAEPGTGK